jgi:uncharacterized protein (DUF433 family)
MVRSIRGRPTLGHLWHWLHRGLADYYPGEATMEESQVLERIVCDLRIFGGQPIIRGHRLAVVHVLGMLAAGDSTETIVAGYPWMEREDVLACLAYAKRVVAHERVEPIIVPTAT